MTDKLHLTPKEAFPEVLKRVSDHELRVLDSRVQRRLDREVVAGGEPAPKLKSATTNWTKNSPPATNAEASSD